jgi:hypothetical protein
METETTRPGLQSDEYELEHDEEHGAEEEHVHLPALSVWPITMALGITLLGMGAVTVIWMTYLGLAIMFISLIYWIQELRHEHR